MKRQIMHCKISYNKPVARGIYLLGLKAGRKLKLAPGQFFMLRVEQGLDPLLGRPLDWFYYDPQKDLLEFVYQVVGRGTDLLSKRKPGATISILGPLGKGWDWKSGRRDILLVAGGLGIPGLWDFCMDPHKHRSCSMTLIWGARSKDQFFLLNKIPKAVNFIPMTEDGSLGEKGLVTDRVKKMLESGYRPQQIFSCGPQLMLKALAGIARKYEIPGQVLYTERMACGFGACLGCAVPGAGGGYLHVCTDGPAFKFEEIDWERVK
jgi:dihydroorotate dehydrogenase electron transfer subunit